MMRPVALFALFLQLSQAALAAEPAPLVSAAELALNYSLPLVWTAPLPPTSLAYLNATASRSFLIDNWNLSSGTAASLSFVPNPVSAGVAGAEGLVLEVDYPVGTRVGAQFHMSPFEDFTSVQTAVLSYQLAFSEGFGFVKGGKLPGLYGGDLVDQCTGGERTLACFSARLMWRARGAGEVYVYTPTYDYFCNTRSVLCNLEYGISISRDSFTFVPNKWMTITQLISLNTPPLNNGVLALYVNGKLAMQHNNMAWRDNTSVALSRVLFSTFFGGGDATWNSRGGQTYYRGFEAYAGSAPSALAGMAVNITVLPTIAAAPSRLSHSTLFFLLACSAVALLQLDS